MEFYKWLLGRMGANSPPARRRSLKNWDVLIVTASSARQAMLYRDEIERRRVRGMLPQETEFLVVPDRTTAGRQRRSDDQRTGGSGQGSRVVENASGVADSLRGDSRRLPQYSPGGKLFGVLPSRTQPRATTTVFDETLALSAAWAERIATGCWWLLAM